MKLRSDILPAFASVLFLFVNVWLGESVRDDWTAEYNASGPRSYAMQAANTPGDSVAIPGVFGYGANAFQDCHDVTDTVIVETVTTTTGDASVPGTIWYILTNSQHGDTLTVVTFDTGGWAHSTVWDGKLECIYIAGQTAPGDGFGMSRYRMLRIRNDSYGFVIRGLTFTGYAIDAPGDDTPDIQVENAQDFIFMENMHLWSNEKHLTLATLSANDTVRDATLFRNLFGQTNISEPTSITISESAPDNGEFNAYIDFSRNLWHTVGWRSPYIIQSNSPNDATTDAVPRVRLRGNAWYNAGYQAHVQVSQRMVDVIDARVKVGPMTFQHGDDFSWVVSVHSGGIYDSAANVYVERLIGAHNRDTLTTSTDLWFDGADDGDAEVSCYYNDCQASGGGNPRTSAGAQIKRDTAITSPTFEFPRVNPFALDDEIFGTATDSGQVGPYRHAQCDGTFAFRADSMLSALLKEARDSTGLNDIFGLDENFISARYQYTKAAGSACTDTDGDGMPDAFEVRIQGGVDSTGAVVTGDGDNDGFANLIEYVNGTDPTVYTSSAGSEGEDIAPTYTSTWKVWARRLAASRQPVHGGDENDSFPVPTYPDSLPESGQYLPDTFAAPSRVMHFTCDSVVGYGAPLDSSAWRDTITAMGLDPDSLLAWQPAGCVT